MARTERLPLIASAMSLCAHNMIYDRSRDDDRDGLKQLNRLRRSHPGDVCVERGVGLRNAANGGVVRQVACLPAHQFDPGSAKCAAFLFVRCFTTITVMRRIIEFDYG